MPRNLALAMYYVGWRREPEVPMACFTWNILPAPAIASVELEVIGSSSERDAASRIAKPRMIGSIGKGSPRQAVYFVCPNRMEKPRDESSRDVSRETSNLPNELWRYGSRLESVDPL